eukprot:4174717-Alexandrium_andersonii.AAC.1
MPSRSGGLGAPRRWRRTSSSAMGPVGGTYSGCKYGTESGSKRNIAERSSCPRPSRTSGPEDPNSTTNSAPRRPCRTNLPQGEGWDAGSCRGTDRQTGSGGVAPRAALSRRWALRPRPAGAGAGRWATAGQA